MQTIVGLNDPKAIRKWSGMLAVDMAKEGYWSRRFVGTGDDNIIQQLTDLQSEAGQSIVFDLVMQLKGRPTTGDNPLAGREENLSFYSDEVYIDQTRHSVSAGGRMTRKRTLHDLRSIAKSQLARYWAAYVDQLLFMYLSGARGINENFIEDTTFTGHAGNAFQAPDSAHILYGAIGGAKATLTTADKMTQAVVERAETYSTMIQATNPAAINMTPVSVEGEDRFVIVMSPYAEHDLRTADTNGWIKIQAAAAAAEGSKSNAIFKGGLGMIKNTILHKHTSAIRFNDYGAGANVLASRSLFMGKQAGVVAYGTPGGSRFTWVEKEDDYENQINVACGTIVGTKKTRFNSTDFGVIAIDTAAAAVN